jgi:hypothetical protein
MDAQDQKKKRVHKSSAEVWEEVSAKALCGIFFVFVLFCFAFFFFFCYSSSLSFPLGQGVA